MSQKKPQPAGGPGKGILVFVLAMVLLFASTTAVLIFSGLSQGVDLSSILHSAGGSDGASVDTRLYGTLLFAALAIVIFGLWYRSRFILPYRHIQPTTPRGFSVLTILTLLLLAFGAQFLSEEIMTALRVPFGDMVGQFTDMSARLFSEASLPFLPWIYAIILGPIAEELIFRGLVYRFARLKMTFMGANLLQAVLFAVYHLNLVQGIYAFVIGLIFGFIASRGRGIRYSILLHILFNLVAVLGKDFIPSITALMPVPVLLISIGLVIFTMFAFAYEFMPVKRRNPHEQMDYANEDHRYNTHNRR